MFDQSRDHLTALGDAPARLRMRLVHNPTSGLRNARRLGRFLRVFAAQGMAVSVQRTGRCGDAQAFAAETSAGADVLAVAGGDGTINEVLNGVRDASLPIAIVPLGTANVVAAEVGSPRRPFRLAKAISARGLTEAYLPRANGRRFAMMVGVGFDAHVVVAVNRRLKRVLGKGAFVLAFIKTLREFPYRRYDIVIDGRAYRAASVIIANGHFYGGRFTCAPAARLDEPDLHVCLFLGTGPWSTIRYGLSLVLGTLYRRPDFQIVRGRHIEVRGAPGEPVQCDGDAALALPLTVVATGDRVRFVTSLRSPA